MARCHTVKKMKRTSSQSKNLNCNADSLSGLVCAFSFFVAQFSRLPIPKFTITVKWTNIEKSPPRFNRRS